MDTIDPKCLNIRYNPAQEEALHPVPEPGTHSTRHSGRHGISKDVVNDPHMSATETFGSGGNSSSFVRSSNLSIGVNSTPWSVGVGVSSYLDSDPGINWDHDSQREPHLFSDSSLILNELYRTPEVFGSTGGHCITSHGQPTGLDVHCNASVDHNQDLGVFAHSQNRPLEADYASSSPLLHQQSHSAASEEWTENNLASANELYASDAIEEFDTGSHIDPVFGPMLTDHCLALLQEPPSPTEIVGISDSSLGSALEFTTSDAEIRQLNAFAFRRPGEMSAPRRHSSASTLLNNATYVSEKKSSLPDLAPKLALLPKIRSNSFHSGPLASQRRELMVIQQLNGTKHDPLSITKRGIRKGPLDKRVRDGAKAVRQNKIVCIRCKKDRQSCDGIGDQPCTRCKLISSNSRSTQPRTKAHFFSIVQSGTCNYISQRACNHLTLDGSRRVRIDLPETFDLDHVLNLIERRHQQFNIRVTQGGSSIYVINLERCFNYLSSIRKGLKEANHDLRGFIDNNLLKHDGWEDCVSETDPRKDLMALLYVWGNMPSRATYSFVPKKQRFLPEVNQLPEKVMDVEDAEEQVDVLLAAQLSRIVCRKLELDAYEHLQRSLNNFSNLNSEDTLKFVEELGLILLTLRWRVSWWNMLGDGGAAPDIGKERFENRVNSLCRILYFYYCSMRRKLPSFSDVSKLGGVWSNYADTSLAIYDDFPDIESIEGFEAWMNRGRELISKAGVANKLAGIGLKGTS